MFAPTLSLDNGVKEANLLPPMWHYLEAAEGNGRKIGMNLQCAYPICEEEVTVLAMGYGLCTEHKGCEVEVYMKSMERITSGDVGSIVSAYMPAYREIFRQMGIPFPGDQPPGWPAPEEPQS